MDLRELRYLLAVAEAGSFRRAALETRVRQSTLSRGVAALENDLGVSLFERDREGVRLTNAGQRFLRRARRVLAEAEIASRVARAAGTGNEGSVCVGIVASIASGQARSFLRSWRDGHTDLLLDFVDGGPGEHVHSVVARKMDVAFLTGARVPPGCDAELVWTEPVFVALPSDHLLAVERTIPLKAIAAEMFIVSRVAPGPEIHDYVVKNLSELGRHPDVGYHAVGRETLMAMVGLGMGVSLVSGAEAGVQYPGVTFIPLSGEQLPFSMIWLAQNDNPALRRFLSAARVHARSQRGRDVAST